MTNDKTAWIDEELAALENEGLRLAFHTVASPQQAWLTVDGKKLLNFCSNNYLGLASDPRLVSAAKEAMDAYGVGPGAVRTISGTTVLHTKLEQRLAAFKKVEDTVILPSGFVANLAVIPAMVGKEDILFSDRLNHASIIDGCRLSGATIVPYDHCSVDHLRTVIHEQREKGFRRGLIVSDGVFSMDGDIAPLPGLVEVAEAEGLPLMVDDAHGEGVLGDHGRGVVDHFDLHGRVDIEVGTFSKAFGVVGGFVAGSKRIVSWIRQRGRPFLFSSAMTIPDTAACLAALTILEKDDALVRKLWENAKMFQERLRAMGLDIGQTQTPITPVMVGEAKTAQAFSKRLYERGVYVVAIGFPMVAKGKARIRVMLSAAHSEEDVMTGLTALEEVGRDLGLVKSS